MEIGDVAVAEEDPGDVETSGGEEGDAAWTTLTCMVTELHIQHIC